MSILSSLNLTAEQKAALTKATSWGVEQATAAITPTKATASTAPTTATPTSTAAVIPTATGQIVSGVSNTTLLVAAAIAIYLWKR